MTDKEDIIENREALKHQMVVNKHKQNKEDGSFEAINEIFMRLPLPRLEKISYKFLFDKVKHNVENILSTENKIQIM